MMLSPIESPDQPSDENSKREYTINVFKEEDDIRNTSTPMLRGTQDEAISEEEQSSQSFKYANEKTPGFKLDIGQVNSSAEQPWTERPLKQ